MSIQCKCKRVAVIGAGIGGLASVKACKEEGLEVAAFDSRSHFGGMWSGSDDPWHPDGPAMYSSLITNTSKSTSSFSDFPCPKDFPPYLPYRKFKEYIQLYVDHFDLAPHYKLNTNVTRIRKTKDHDETGRWVLSIQTSGEEERQEEFDGVIVCIGFFTIAHYPGVPGLKTSFKGRVLHSKDYRNSSAFAGRNVLVVGNASSAGDISCDISNVANQVYQSVGRGMCLVSRVTSSVLPADFGFRRVLVKMFSQERLLSILNQKAQKMFDHVKSGLQFTDSRFKDCPTVVNDELPAKILSGKVKILPYVTEYVEKDIVTETGDVYRDIDDVVLATGYKRDLSILDPSLDCYGNKLNLYKHMFPVGEKHHTLACVGLQRAVGTLVPILEVQARLAALTLSGKHTLPPRHVMQRDIDRLNEMAARPDGTYNYSYLSTFISDSIADEFGVAPKFWKLVFSGKLKLAFQCFFGPALPYHYRLCGPGKWDGAQEAINQAISDNLAPLQGRPLEEKKSKIQFRRVWPIFLLLASAGIFVHYDGVEKVQRLHLLLKIYRFLNL